MPKSYDHILEVFDTLNAAGCRYLVLRNHECMLRPELFVGDHADIDLLCADSQEVAAVLDAGTWRPDRPPLRGDGIHYQLTVGGRRVPLDLRQAGDGYYCEQWERDLLDRRVLRDGIYVMAPEDYFYTLTYHAILQKPALSDEYRERLLGMAAGLGIEVRGNVQRRLLEVLQNHMVERGYTFTYPVDHLVPCRFRLVRWRMVTPHRRMWRHWRFAARVWAVQRLVAVKHAILGKK